MTKEEQKAIELIKKYASATDLFGDETCNEIMGKQLATLECQSIIDELKSLKVEFILEERATSANVVISRIDFYKGVIKAIEQQ